MLSSDDIIISNQMFHIQKPIINKSMCSSNMIKQKLTFDVELFVVRFLYLCTIIDVPKI